MTTKIKGHRIAPNTIERSHLSPSVVFYENDLILNNPTHNNTNDLSEIQKNILTQNGNADGFHYHTGGDGGPSGILTRPEIDKSIMELMLKVNSIQTGLENVVLDDLDDTNDLDYGCETPSLSLSVLEGVDLLESLMLGSSYSYRLATKTTDGISDVSTEYTITIPNEGFNFPYVKIDLKLANENTGYKLYRRKTDDLIFFALLEDITSFETLNKLEYEVLPGESIIEGNYLSIKPSLSTITSLTEINSENNLIKSKTLAPLYNSDYLFNFSYNELGVKYSFITHTRENKVDIIKINFYDDEFKIPRKFKVDYSLKDLPNVNNDSDWLGFSNMINEREYYNFDYNNVVMNSIVSENSDSTINLKFDLVENLTAIRISILEQESYVNLTELIVENQITTPANNAGNLRKIIKTDLIPEHFNQLDYSIRLSNSVTIPTIKMRFLDEKYRPVFSNTKTYCKYETKNVHSVYSNNVVRTSVRMNSDGYYNWDNTKGLKFQFLQHDNNEITIKNVTIAASDAVSRKNLIAPYTLTPVTFNGGVSSITTTDDIIETDIIIINNIKRYMEENSDILYSLIITFEIEGGTLWHDSDSYCNTYYSDDLGVSTSSIDGTEFVNQTANYTPIMNIVRYEAIQNIDLVFNEKSKNRQLFMKNRIPIIPNASAQKTKFIEFELSNIEHDNIIDIGNIIMHDKSDFLNDLNVLSYTNVNDDHLFSDNDSVYSTPEVPTSYAPTISTYLFGDSKKVDNMKISFYNNASFSSDRFVIQISNDGSANLSDPIDSLYWSNLKNPRITNDYIRNVLFTGTLNDEGFIDNNLFDIDVDITFDYTEITGIRLIVFSNIIPEYKSYFSKITLYEALYTNRTYELISEGNFFENINVSINDFNDTGMLVDVLDLPKNTTATHNILFEYGTNLIIVNDKTENGYVVTKTIPTTGVLNFLMNVQSIVGTGDAINVYVSNDDGATYQEVIDFNSVTTLIDVGNELKIKFELINNAKINAYSILYSN